MTEKALTYGREDRPPLRDSLLLGAQHAVVALVFLVYPLAAAQQIGLDPASTARFLTACVLGIGVSTFLHAFRPSVGSGALAVEIPTPIFLPAAVMAGAAGGLSMLAAISLLSGCIELLFARALKHIKNLFPAEVCGIAVMMLGISIVKPGMMNALGVTTPDSAVHLAALYTSASALLTIVLVSVFGSSSIKLLAIACGLATGALAAYVTDILDGDSMHHLAAAAWLAWPDVSITVPHLQIDFVPVAVVMALVLSVDNVGMLIGIQRQMDPAWRKIDLKQASGGVQVSGIGDIVSGVFGGMPTGISSANVALAHATGAVARRISWVVGLMLIVAAFAPKVMIAFTMVPRPVVGAVMVYAAIYMVMSGMSLIHGRMLSDRRIFVIGFSLVMGLTSVVLPGIYADVPGLLRPICLSPLATSTLVAMALTYMFSIGASVRAAVAVSLSHSPNESLQEFEINKALRAPLERLGADVGADRASLDRSIDVTAEFVAALQVSGAVRSPVRVAARFDDARLQISLAYTGDAPAMTVGGDPTVDHQRARLARIAQNINKLSASERGGEQVLSLLFEP
jgi:xanthine permease XanP